MRSTLFFALPLLALTACQSGTPPATVVTTPDTTRPATLHGTYKLMTALIITKGDTQHTFPVNNQEMIKMFNG
ncbi:MAG TPA: hypothetical protein VGC22_03030, partial [Chitinophaga sp.]